MTGIKLIAMERARQLAVEGYSAEHDTEHRCEQLARAAVCYATPTYLRREIYLTDQAGYVPELWPWDCKDWKPEPEDRIRELVKAGALIAAEIDRLQRGIK